MGKIMNGSERLMGCVFDDVSRTLIFNEYFHLFLILDVICCVKLQLLPTHFLQHSLCEHCCSIFIFSSGETTTEILIINSIVTKGISNLKIKIYYQNGLYISTPSPKASFKICLNSIYPLI